jgi:hypothetical protein
MASLWVISGSRAGQSVTVTSEVVIGRRNADLTIDDDPGVSRRHAAVRLDGGQLEVEDLGSSNGTFVDGSRIEGPVKVGGGAKIRVGRTEFEVRGVLPAMRQEHDSAASRTADPQATRVTPSLDPGLTKVSSQPDPQVTHATPRRDPQVTQARPATDPHTTKAHTTHDPQVTQARSVPVDLPKPQASSRSVLDKPPPIGPAPVAPTPESSRNAAAQVGAFSAPARRRGRGLASRSWVPTVASFGTAIAAAAGLVVYFIVHGVPS